MTMMSITIVITIVILSIAVVIIPIVVTNTIVTIILSTLIVIMTMMMILFFAATTTMANIAHHSLLHTALGCLLLASYTQGYYDDVSVSPTITLADWPLHPHLPASFLATVDKVVITSFISVRSEPAQPHHLLVTKNGGVFLYGKSAHLGFGM